jgi:hypothetical protein
MVTSHAQRTGHMRGILVMPALPWLQQPESQCAVKHARSPAACENMMHENASGGSLQRKGTSPRHSQLGISDLVNCHRICKFSKAPSYRSGCSMLLQAGNSFKGHLWSSLDSVFFSYELGTDKISAAFR